MPKKSDWVFHNERDVQSYLISLIRPIYLMIATLGAFSGTLRMLDTGWQPIYGYHLVLAVITVVVFLSSNHWISKHFKIVFAVLIPALVGTPALFVFGFYSNAPIWLVTSCSMAAIFFSSRTALAIALFELFCVMAAGLLFTQHQLQLPMDANAYIHQSSGWLSLVVGTGIAVYMAMLVLIRYRSSLNTLISTVEQQRDLIRHQADHDVLTGLPTLRLAKDRLQHACTNARILGSQVGVLFLDLDGFKAANDQYGHEAGDWVLVEVAARLQSILDPSATPARLGGDEFVIILENLHSCAEAEAVAAQLLALLSAPIDYQGQSIHIGGSIGIALLPEHADSAEQLMRNADLAMYQVKKSGKHNFAVFAPTGRDQQILAYRDKQR